MTLKQINYAGFWVRAVADLIDSLILDLIASMMIFLVLGAVYWIQILFLAERGGNTPAFSDFFNPFWIQVELVVLRMIISFFYYSWITFWWGTTPGKLIFKIKVVKAKDLSAITLKQSIIRCLGYVLSYIPFGTGFLMVAFQPEKRGLHDFIAGTICIRNPDPMQNNKVKTEEPPVAEILPNPLALE